MTPGRNAVPGPETAAPARPAPVPPSLVIGAAIFGISWAAIFVRWSTASVFALAFWRLAFSLLVIAAALLVGRRGYRDLALRPTELLSVLLAGALLAFHFVTWFVSLSLTSVASSTLLVNMQPLFAAALSALWLRERPGRTEWAGILLAVGGGAVIGGAGLAGGPDALVGNVLALFAGLLAAGYYVIGRSLRQRVGIWPYVGMVYLTAALLLAVVMLVRSDPFFDYPAREWWLFAGLAAGPMLLGHTGLNWALRYVRAYIVNLAVLGEPIGATLLAWWLIGPAEAPGPATAVGGVLVLTGLAISIYYRRGRKRER